MSWPPGSVPARYDAISLDYWLLGEVGEVIDVIKKDGYTQVMADEAVRAHFIEELADILMYYHDILLCYRISPMEYPRRKGVICLRGNFVRWRICNWSRFITIVGKTS